MAKKKKFDTDKTNIGNDLDFPDYDFDLPSTKDDRKPVTKIVTGLAAGVKSTVTDPTYIKNTIRNSLPTGYGDALDLTDELAGSVKKVYSDAVKDIRPVVKDLKRTTKRIIPLADTILPRKISEKIKRWSESDLDSKSISAEEQRNASLQAQLGEIFKYQSESAMQQNAEASAKENIQASIEHARHKDNFSQLDAQRISLQQLVNYQNKVTAGFQRQSLELQFRHYYVAVDTLIETKRQNAVTTAALELITKNTGLPEFAKLQKTEYLQQSIRNKFIDSAYDAIREKRRSFIKKVTENVGKSVKDKLGEILQAVSTGISLADTATDAGSQISESGVDSLSYGAEQVGGFATNYLTDKVTKRAKKITEANPTIAKGGRKASIITKNFPQIVNEVAQDDEYTEQEGFIRKGLGFLLNAFGGVGRDAVRSANRIDTSLQVDSAGSLLETSKAGFTNRSDRSLNEVIPGLLSRIHRELKIIRTGDEKTELIDYDFTKGTFSEKSTIIKGIKNSLLNKNVKEGVNSEVDEVLKKLDPQGKLTVEATDALRKLFLSDNLTGIGKSGTFDRLTKESTYRGETYKYSSTIIDLVRTNLIGEGDSSARELEFTRLFSNIGTSIADPRASIQTLVNLGYTDYLKEIGVITEDGKTINLKAYYEYYLDTSTAGPDEVVSPTSKRKRRRPATLKPATPLPNAKSFTNAPTALPNFDQNTPGQAAGASGLGKESTMMLMESIDKINPKPELMMVVDLLTTINKRLAAGIITYGSADVESADGTGKAWWDKSIKDTAIAGKDIGLKGFDALRGFIKTAAGKIGTGLSQISAPLLELGKKGFNTIVDRLRSIRDVYIKGEIGPRVLAYKIKLGHYVDVKTGVVIKAYTDITGAIKDITLPEGSAPVISDEDIGNAEVRDNFVVRTIKSLGAKVRDGVTVVKNIIDSLPARVQTGIQLAKKAFDFIFSQPQDVYVKGKKLPVLIGTTMKNGGYLSALTGKTIAHPGEIDGAVLEATNGQTVLTQEEFYGGLYNAKGEIIKTGVAKLVDEARKIADFAGNQVRKGLKAIGSGLAKGVRAVGEFIGKASPTINIGNSYEAGEYQSIGIITRLTQIRDILNKRLEGQPDEFESDDFAMPEDPKKPRLKNAGFITRLGRGLRKATSAGLSLIGKSVASSTKLAVDGVGLAAKGVIGAGKLAFNSAGTLGRLGLGAAKLTGKAAASLTGGANKAAGYVYDAATGLYRFVGDGLAAAGGALKKAGNNLRERSSADANLDPANPTSPGAPGLKRNGFIKTASSALGSGLSGIASLFGPIGDALFGAGGLLVSGAGKLGKGLLNAGKGLKDRLFGENKQLKVLTEIRDLLSARLPKPTTAAAGLDKATIAEKTKSLFGDETPENKDDNGPNGSATGEKGGESLLDEAADIAEIGDAVRGRGGRRAGGKVLKGGGTLLGKAAKVGKLGLKGLGVAGLAYGGYSAVDNFSKGNYGEAALDAGLAGVGAATTFGGLGAVGAGLGTAAAAIGGVLASPALLAGLAVAAVGVGAYYGYKYLTKNKLETLSTYRYAQYGFLASDDKHLQPVFSLEEDLMPGIIYVDGVAKFDPSKVKLNDVAKKFGVDEKNGKQLNQLVAWFNGRFKPVYLTHLTALKKTNPEVALADIDSKLKPMEKKTYLTLVEFPEGPYGLRTSPFVDQPDGLVVSNSEVKDAYTTAKAKVEQEATKETTKEGDTGKSVSVTTAAGLGLAAAGPLGAVAGAAIAATTGTKTSPTGIDSQKLSNDLTKSAVLTGVDTGIGAIAASGMVAPMANFGNGIDPLMAVRFKAYGLTELRMDRARVFKVLEDAIMIDVTFNSKKEATWAGSIDRVIARYGVSFNIDSQSGKATNDFIRWFNFRFLPVFLNYATNLAAFSGKQNLTTALDSLSTQGMYDLAVVIVNTMSSQDGSRTPVWNITSSPWNDYTLNQDRASTNGEIALLKSRVKTEIVPTKGLASEGGGAAAVAAAGITQVESVNKPGLLSRAYSNTVEAVSRGVGAAYDYLVDKTSQGIESGINASKAVGAAASGTYNAAVDKTSRGIESVANTIAGLTKGDGGTYDSIPFPKASGTWAGLKDTIMAAASAVGVDPLLLARIAASESGFKYDIKNPGGSATGLFQFISTTWDSVMKKYGAQFGIPAGTKPTDPRANALLGAQFIKDNIQSIQKYLDRGVSPTDVYMAHFLGDAGAKKFLTTNPNELVTNVFPKIVAQNASVVFDAKNGGAPRTLGQVYDYFTGRLNSVARGFKLGSDAPSTGTPTPPVDPAIAAKTVVTNDGNAVSGGNAVDADANKAASGIAAKAVSPVAGATAFGTATPPLLSNNLVAANAVTPTTNSGSAAPATPPGVSPGISGAVQASALAGGFTSSAVRPTNDLTLQAKARREEEAKDMMGPISETLSKSMNIQQGQLEALQAILQVITNGGSFTGADVNKQKTDALGTNGPEYRSSTPAPTAPVSMRKAAY